ncbi:MAG: hypothetical protein IKP00_15585 [Victivallales bacterium]|nr:hypothetical protein [Victivallales bacterium]
MQYFSPIDSKLFLQGIHCLAFHFLSFSLAFTVTFSSRLPRLHRHLLLSSPSPSPSPSPLVSLAFTVTFSSRLPRLLRHLLLSSPSPSPSPSPLVSLAFTVSFVFSSRFSFSLASLFCFNPQ